MTDFELTNGELEPEAPQYTILVVDSDRYSRLLLVTMLSSSYNVIEAATGDEALQQFHDAQPDLILIEGQLPGLDGYETCQRIRAISDVPVIFVSSDSSIDFTIEAFDCGANDFIAKPFDIRVLAKKVNATIEVVKERKHLQQENEKHAVLSNLLFSSMSDGSTLLNFMRGVLKCTDFASIADCIVATLKSYGLECCVRIRNGMLNITRTSMGDPSSLELSVLNHVSSLGRAFQFKNRLAVNYDNVTVVLFNLPEDPDHSGRIRDNVTILCESAQALAENLMRQFDALREKQSVINDSAKARECLHDLSQLQSGYQLKMQMLLHNFVSSVESEYRTMDLLLEQERRISSIIERHAQHMFEAFHENGHEFNTRTNEITSILLPSAPTQTVDLF